MTELELLRQWVRESRRMVFRGRGGGLHCQRHPGFPQRHGLYQQKKAGLSYEEMLSHRYFVHHTAEFYDFLRGVMLYPDAKPNGAHYALARLEREGRLRAVITQNIDGSIKWRAAKTCWSSTAARTGTPASPAGRSTTCPASSTPPACPSAPAGGRRPDVVLYGEALNEKDLRQAIRYAEEADLMLVAGTSLVVYPVAGLVEYLAPAPGWSS